MTTGSKIRSNRIGQGDNPETKRGGRVDVLFDTTVTFSDDGAAAEWATAVIAGLPPGLLLVQGGALFLEAIDAVTGGAISDTFVLSASLGTTATADNSPATTDINLATHVALTAATGGVARVSRGLNGLSTVAGATSAAPGYIDNSDGTTVVNLNLTLADASVSAEGSLRVRGRLVLDYDGYGPIA